MIEATVRAFIAAGLTPKRFLVRQALPIAALGLLVGVLAGVFLPGVHMSIRIIAALGAPTFALAAVVLYPRAMADRKRRQIDDNIHFYVTHMGVLAAADLAPVEILSKLGGKKEYGALAEASDQIADLVHSWNMALPEACRFVADRVTSTILADFLERLAYAFESGEDLLAFLKSEQGVVMGDYATQYQANLYGVDAVKDMYLSTMMSVVFLVIFGLLSPVLTGTDPGVLVWAVALLVIIMEGIFVFLLMARVPNDRLWSADADAVGIRRDIDRYLPATLALCAAAGAFTWYAFSPGAVWTLAAASTPLLVLGSAVAVQERSILRKDDNFPAFVRSLGASAAARGGDVKAVLERLRRHDFGPLSDHIESLYRRLNMRLADERAWRRFAQETSSNLIDTSVAMFTEGIESGGDAGEVGRIVSENVVRILALRKHRVQSAQGFRGMMLGMTAGMAGTLFIGIGLLRVLTDLFTEAKEVEGAGQLGFVLGDMNVDVGLMTAVVTSVMVIHNLVGAYMVTAASGGSGYRMTLYVPALMWITALSAAGASLALSTVG